MRRPVEAGAPDGSKVTLLRYWAVSIVSPFERFFHASATTPVTDGRTTLIYATLVSKLRPPARDCPAASRTGRICRRRHARTSPAVPARLPAALCRHDRCCPGHRHQRQRSLSRDLHRQGAKDGLKTDQPVITPDGIVGKLRDVFPHTSQVLLINDQTSGAGVLLATTRIRAILRGSTTARSSSTTSRPTSASSPAKRCSAQAVIRSIHTAFPSAPSNPSRSTPTTSPTPLIQLRPAANLNQLEEVLVITAVRRGFRSRHRRI